MPKTASPKRPNPAATPNPQTKQHALHDQMQQARQESRAALQAQRAARVVADRRARQRRRILLGTGSAVVALLLIAGLAYWYNFTHPGESVPDMADRHHLTAATDAHVAYSTDPPTSGPHTQDLAEWRVFDTQQPNELLVHNLEDAGVIVNYRPGLAAADVTHLTTIVNSYEQNYITMRTVAGDTQRINRRVVMEPYAGLKDTVVLTAWGRMQRFQSVDETAIRHFIDMYRGIDHHESAPR